MALTKAEDLRVSSELYEAVTNGMDAKVIDICAAIPKGPLHTPTVHDDTVLSLATNLKNNDLALKLLDMVPMCDSHKLTFQNNGGHTMLHETGLSNKTVAAAAEMLRRAPMLLSMTNRLGETALFTAAVYGKTKIFKFLHGEVCRTTEGPDMKTFLQRDDKSTILHRAILSRNYWMAHEIAVKHEHLIHETDGDEMTPLQLLSCSPPIFGQKSFFMRMIYKVIDQDFEDTSKMLPWLRKMRKEKHRYEWAMKLVRLLVKADTSWEMTESWIKRVRSTVHSYGRSKSVVENEKMLGDVHKPDTPLLLATIHGCKEIVSEILKVYPQAIEHIDKDGRNLLSLAILHRRIEILDVVENMKIQKQRVKRNIDNYGNTLLHLVGEKVDCPTEDLKGPALVLQEDALLFERVKESCTTLDTMRLNLQGKTAEKDFEKSLFQKLYLGLTLLIISVAMMMVAFAATLILTISSGRKWTDITLYSVSFFPVVIFIFTYVKLYKQLVGAIYRGFKHMMRVAFWYYERDDKPIAWRYEPRSQLQHSGSRSVV
ncbi:hypothetical protein L6452_19540 [Arctium lappa]|uniref:Uncharacterized protein n=1 Tax=Arctium lappa TaxID=4217 RepID=A0ACB9BA86_ARCLA|nr:hypothetical protein L6452_19540 [Arctium lappa]